MRNHILLSLLGVFLVTLLGSYFFWQSQRITEQKEIIQKQQTTVGTLVTANTAQNATIRALQQEQAKKDTLIVDAATQNEKLILHITALDDSLKEALNNAPVLTIDSVLPRDASNAFCLQWYAASGIYPNSANNTAKTTKGAYERKGNTNATGNKTTNNCRAWGAMTVRDAVEWSSLLLQHAGLEREDKKALRKWALE